MVGCASTTERSAETPGSLGFFRETPSSSPFIQPWTQSSANSCEMSEDAREQILKIAAPENYPNTRYRKRPRSFPKETDCSHFVHHVYSSAGFPYGYQSSRSFSRAEEFQPVPARDAKPGDIVLFRNHMGILSSNYRIISATRQKKSIQELEAHAFPRLEKTDQVFRYKCPQEILGQITNSPATKQGKTP